MTLPVAVAACARAAQESAHPTQNLSGLCDHAVAGYYGLPHSGSPSARLHWHAIPADRKHTGNPPAGALLFFGNASDTGNWHITLATGDAVTNWTTDMVRPGKVDRTRVDATARWVGLSYLGWTDPVFPGAGKDFGVLVPPPSRHQRHLAHLRVVLSRHLAHLAHLLHLRRKG